MAREESRLEEQREKDWSEEKGQLEGGPDSPETPNGGF